MTTAADLAAGANLLHAKQMEAQVQKVKEITGVELPKYYNPSAINPLKYAEQIKKRQMLWGNKKKEDEADKDASGSVAAVAAAAAAAKVSAGLGLGSSGTAAPKSRLFGGLGGFVASKSDSSSSSSSADPKGKPSAVVLDPIKRDAVILPGGVKQSFNKWESTNFGDTSANEKFRRLMGIKAPVGDASAEDKPTTNSSKLFSAQEQQYERARMITHTAKGLGLGFGGGVPQPPPPAPEN